MIVLCFARLQKSYKKEESDIPKNINITSTKKEIITTNLKKEANYKNTEIESILFH